MPGSSARGRLARASQALAIRRRVRPARAPAGADLLQSLLDNIPDTIYFKDTASRFTRINRAQARVLGVAHPADALGKTDFDFQWEHIARASFEQEQAVMATGQPLLDSIEFNPTPGGEPRWFSNTKAPIRDRAGRVIGLVGISRDVTEQQQAQTALQALRESLETQVADRTRALLMLSECNQALVRADDETTLLGDICRSLVEVGGYVAAWVGFAAAGARGTLQTAARAGTAQPANGALTYLAADAAAGQRVIISNFQNEAARREQAARQGIASGIAFPFALDSRGQGVLTIGSARADAFNAAETELLEQLVHDLAYGLRTLSLRAALERTDELLRETSRLAHVGGWEMDVASQTVSWSDETFRIHEMAPGALPALSQAINFYAPEARPVIAGAIERAIADGTPYDLELPFITATGRRRWVRAQALAEMRDGQCVRLWGTFQDITDRKRTDDQIRRSARRVEALSQISKVLAEVSTNSRAVIEAAARLVADLIGDGCTVQLAASSGPHFDPVAHYHRDPAAANALRDLLIQFPPRTDDGLGGRVYQTGEAMLVPVISLEQLHGATPPEYWGYFDRYPLTSLLGVPLRSEGGVIGVVTLTRITPDHPYTAEDQSFLQELADRVALVITNARLYEELERRVAERTHSLEASNNELEAFSYSVSHDLRAPLRALDGFSLALLEDFGPQLDAQGRDYLNRIRAASNKMGELIDALLALARVTRAPLRYEPVDLSGPGRGCDRRPARQRTRPRGGGGDCVRPGRPRRPAPAARRAGEPAGECLEVHRPRACPAHRSRRTAQLDAGARRRVLRARQRRRLRYGPCRPPLRRLPAAARPGRLRRHRHRPGHAPSVSSPATGAASGPRASLARGRRSISRCRWSRMAVETVKPNPIARKALETLPAPGRSIERPYGAVRTSGGRSKGPLRESR